MRLTIRNSDGTVSQPTNTTIESVFERLAEYEDAEEQGRLIKLPFKRGAEAWLALDDAVSQVVVCDYMINETLTVRVIRKNNPLADEWVYADQLHKSKEEAEAALKGV